MKVIATMTTARKLMTFVMAMTASVALAVNAQVNAATINWNFTSGTGGPVSMPADFASGGTVVGGNGTVFAISAVSASSGYSGASGGNNAAIADNTRGALAADSAYFGFSLTLDGATNVEFTDFDFGSRSTGTGPQLLTLRASTDNFASFATLGSIAVANNSSWGLRDLTITPFSAAAGETVDFRIYGSNSTGNPSSAANWRIDDLALTYTATAVPEPTALVLAGLSLTGLAASARRRKYSRLRSLDGPIGGLWPTCSAVES